MSCLFRSLSAFLNQVGEDELRQIICNYLDRNPKLLDELSLKDILHVDGMEMAQYVQMMRHPSTWGSALEIKSFCNIFQVAVIVHIRQTGKDIVFQPSSMEHATCLKTVTIEWQGNHYEPVFHRQHFL